MNSHLFGRALGSISPQAFQRAETTRLLHALTLAPGIKFDGRQAGDQDAVPAQGAPEEIWAHRAGTNCLVIDRFEGR